MELLEKLFTLAKRLMPEIANLYQQKPELLGGLLQTVKNLRVGTRFSGILVAEMALSLLEAATRSTDHTPIKPFKYTPQYCCDKSCHCQDHAKKIIGPEVHIYKDMLDLLDKDILHEVNEAEKVESEPWDTWVRLIFSRPLRKQFPCAQHPFRLCPMVKCDCELAGSPCQDYSHH